uniref:Uncharacterized protein n=1 Tax=Micrurus carvalhoi TaxID=3147026 RepID=A0A2H6NAA4_9SAUR
MAFIIEEPIEKGQVLIKELERYGAVAGLKIKRQKMKLLAKTLTELQTIELERVLGLQTTRKIKYLGIWLTSHCKAIKENNYNNYNKLLQQTKKDLELWTKMQLSIAAIKMSILPKFR